MKSITRLKRLMWDNDVTLSMDDKTGQISILLTNKQTNTSSISVGKNWCGLLQSADKDAKIISKQ